MLGFRLIVKADIARIIRLEQTASSTPWTTQMLENSLGAKGVRGKSIVLSQASGDQKEIGYWVIQQVLDEAELLNFVIFPAYQGQGLGKASLEKICTTLLENDVQKIFLEVRDSNHLAQALYTKTGFKQIAIRKGYYQSYGAPEDARILQKELRTRV